MNPEDVAYLTVSDLAGFIEAKAISPVEAVEAAFRQIEQYDSKLHAFISVDYERAMTVARKAEQEIARGKYRGLFHGVPYSAKDVLDTRGIRTTGGTKLFSNYRPRTSSTVIRKLDRAGAVLLGKNNLSEMAMGGTREHTFGTPVNPWNAELSAGGSSSGSAVAVATGMGIFSLGTDTGGSIRGPSRLCGLYGLKPTFGRVSRNGVWPVAWAIDTVGPIARSPLDCGLILSAIAGPDPDDPTTRDTPPVNVDRLKSEPQVKALKIAVLEDLIDLDSDSDQACASREFIEFLKHEGASIETVQAPAIRNAVIAYMSIRDVDNTLVQTDLNRTAESLDLNTRLNILTAALMPAGAVSKVRRIIAHFVNEMRASLRGFDVLVWGTRQRPLGVIRPDDTTPEDVVNGYFASRTGTMFANIAGIPAMSLPVGFGADGGPLGIQVGARTNEDELLVNFARAWERHVGVFHRPMKVP